MTTLTPQVGAAGIVACYNDLTDWTLDICDSPQCGAGTCCSVTPGGLQSDTDVFVFEERRDEVLQADLFLDIEPTGRFDKIPLVKGWVPSGTRINSYFIHAEPFNKPQSFFGRCIFDEPIAGIIVSPDLLDDSDPVLERDGVGYPTGTDYRGGLERVTQDKVLVDPFIVKLNQITVTTHVDQIRVITLPPDRHFVIYRIEPIDVGVAAKFRGQFQEGEWAPGEVPILAYIANPTHKTIGETTWETPDPNEHLTIYEVHLTEQEPERVVSFRNQFGDQTWVIGQPAFIAVIAQKGDLAVPMKGHYMCYEVVEIVEAASERGVTVELNDQFRTIEVELDPAAETSHFCQPVDKEHNNEVFPMHQEWSHLAIYDFERVPLTTEECRKIEHLSRSCKTTFNDTQFYGGVVHVIHAKKLAVESIKLDWGWVEVDPSAISEN